MNAFHPARVLLAGMTALALLAPLPQVFCCCGYSTGPLGVFGLPEECRVGQCAQTCPCCPHCQDEKSDASNGYRCAHVHCTLSLISAAPLASTSGVHLPQPALLVSTIATAGQLAENTDASLSFPLSSDCRAITSLYRCALLQTWQV